MVSAEFPTVLGAVAGSGVSSAPLHEYSNSSINENRAGSRLRAPRYASIWVWSSAAGGYTHIRMWCGGISALGSFSERSLFLFIPFFLIFFFITLYVWNGSDSRRKTRVVIKRVWNGLEFSDQLELISSTLISHFTRNYKATDFWNVTKCKLLNEVQCTINPTV